MTSAPPRCRRPRFWPALCAALTVIATVSAAAAADADVPLVAGGSAAHTG